VQPLCILLPQVDSPRAGDANGVAVANGHENSAAATAEVVERGMVLPFNPLALTFSNMHYYVPLPKVRQSTVIDESVGAGCSTAAGDVSPPHHASLCRLASRVISRGLWANSPSSPWPPAL